MDLFHLFGYIPIYDIHYFTVSYAEAVSVADSAY